MRLNRLKLRNLGPFSEVDLDFSAIEGKLVAITGGNGAGKSTLLELMVGAIYRNCPTRGSLSGLATARDAFVEASVVNGESWHIRQLVDAVSGKGEAVVVDGAGKSALDSSKVSEYDKWAAKNLPSESVMYSTLFAAQGSSGFLDMKPGPRKALLLRVLGIEHLEGLAEKARAKATKAKSALEILQARLDDERVRGGDVEAHQATFDEAKARAARATEEGERAETALTDARAKAVEVDAIIATAKTNDAKRVELQAKRADAAKRLEDVRVRVRNNEEVMKQAGAIRYAVTVDKATAAKDSDARARLQSTEAEAHAAGRDKALAASRELDAQRGVDRARSRLADQEAVEKAVATIDILLHAVDDAERGLADAEVGLAEVRAQQVAGADERIGALRGGLLMVRDETRTDLCPIHAAKTICDDDESVSLAARIPKMIMAEDARVADARSNLAASRRELSSTETLAARADEIAGAEDDLARAEEEVAKAEQEQKDAAVRLDALALLTESLETEIEDCRKHREKVAHLVKMADKLNQAEARIEELAPQAKALVDEVMSADLDIEGIPIQKAPPLPINLDALECALRAVAKEERDATQDEALTKKALEDASASAERRAGLEAETSDAERGLADWKRVAFDLGRDGLQALEIDAAGPELTGLVNDLLWSCVGTRWTVRIDTTRASADGKRQLEGLDVVVVDTERGREAPVETFSGGERVILGEAVSLALTTLATNRAGISGATLIRDESGAALDPENGRAYVAMLRRAAELTGATQVLYVSHSPELQELADARIHIEDGRVMS